MIKNFFKMFFSRLSSKTDAIEALNKTVDIFTSGNEKSFEELMGNGVRPIIDAIFLDRVTIYNRVGEDKKKIGQFYRWDKTAGGMVSIDEKLKILPSIPVVERWQSILLKGDYVIRRFDKIPDDEKDFLKLFGVKSLIIVPIFTQNEFWGAVSFQDHKKERDFDEYIDLLHSIARLYASAAITEEMKQNTNNTIKVIDYDKKMIETLNKASIIFLSQNKGKFDDMMSNGIKLIADVVNLDRISIWYNFMKPDGRHVSQIYRWDRETGGTTRPADILADITYKKLAPSWEEILATNGEINGPARQLLEAAVLKTFGCVSVSSVPIFINNEFWGFGLFEDRRNERYFTCDEMDIMRSTAFLCANTIISNEMENKIKDANEQNDIIVNEAPIAIAVYDENFRIIACNDAISRMFNITKQHFMERFDDLLPEYQPDGLKSADKVKWLMNRALKGEKMTVEWWHVSLTGEPIPCEITTTSMNFEGKTAGLAYIYDLRNTKKLETAAVEAQEMTRTITEASPISYILFDMLDDKWRIVDCNKTTMQVFDCPDKEYLLEHYFDRFCPEYQSNGQNSFDYSIFALNKTVADGKFIFESVHKTLTGELLPMENTLTLLSYKGKKFVISFKYDLRIRKKMIDNINEQNELLKVRLEQQELISDISKKFISTEDSCSSINGALKKVGEYLNVSRTFIFSIDNERAEANIKYQWYKYQWYINDKMLNLQTKGNFNLFNFINKTFSKELSEDSVSIIFCNDVAVDETYNVLKNFNIASFICVPIYVDGYLWGIMSAEQCDVPHKWKESETQIITTVSNIISGAIMRDIYDANLKETIQKVTSLSKAKDEFLSKISHEIRTPMNAILGITEIQLQDETLPLRVIEGLSTIYSSGDSLLRIINDLLDLSKIEAGKLEIIPARYEIASLVNDTAQLNMMRIESKPIEFKLKIDENIPAEFIGDELRVKQILNNILSNAFKYTDSGEVSMYVSAETNKSENSDDVSIIFCISDTGQGMTEEQIRKMFDEYSRFNLNTNRKVEGTGLGMSITQNLIRMMNGDISVESKLGKGSKFTVRLPQKDAKAGVIGKELAENLMRFRINSSAQIKGTKITREPMPYGKVLVVDDVESNLYVAKQLLNPYNLNIETASSGFEAIDKIKEGKTYDIVFMDHMMPKMDGIETVKIIRELGYVSPVVALTANAVAGKSEMFLRNGFDDFISKPIDIRKLNDELNKFIRDKQDHETIEKARRQNKKILRTDSDSNIELLSIFTRDAKKALPILESTLKKITNISDEDLHLFTINVHAMKSALANIGEKILSQMAFTLESAGKKNDKNMISEKTQEFIDNLKALIVKIETETEKENDKDEDPIYLHEQLKIIIDACVIYDGKTANSVLKKLMKMSWTKESREVIDKIGECILHSDFEEAGMFAKDYLEKN